MGTYSFSEEALVDLEDIYQAMSEYSPNFAILFFEKVREKCRQFSQFPHMGKNYAHIKANLRGFIIDDYVILYFPRTDGIDVARIIYGYRDLASLAI